MRSLYLCSDSEKEASSETADVSGGIDKELQVFLSDAAFSTFSVLSDNLIEEIRGPFPLVMGVFGAVSVEERRVDFAAVAISRSSL